MKKFKVKIRTANSAFDGAPGTELARILRELASKIDGCCLAPGVDSLYDINGNTVGEWSNK